MLKSIRRAVREGLEFGACAGLVFILAEIVAAVVQRQPLFYPLRYVLGAVFPSVAFDRLSSSVFVPIGIVLHLAMGGLWGVVYDLLNSCFSERTQTRWERQTVIGLVFGALVWAVKWQLLATYLYPGLLRNRPLQMLELALHTLFFGLPLALFYTSAERRLLPLRRALQE